MATPVFACGFECGQLGTAGQHWAAGGGTPTFSTTTVRSGARSLRSNPSAVVNGFRSSNGYGPSGTLWVGHGHLYFATLPDVDVNLFSSNIIGAGVGFKISDSSIGPVHYVGNTLTYTGSRIAVTTGHWYSVDVRVDSSANPHLIDVQVDGVACTQGSASSAGGSGHTNIDIGANRADGTSVTADVFIDDVVYSATSADYPLGPGRVECWLPARDGDHNVAGANDFERSLLGTDILNTTRDAYTLVDDRPLESAVGDFMNMIAPPNATDYVEVGFARADEVAGAAQRWYFHKEASLRGAPAVATGCYTASLDPPDQTDANGGGGGHNSTNTGSASLMLNKPQTIDLTRAAPGAVYHAPTDAPPLAAHQFGWFTDLALSGSFAAGNWTFTIRESDDRAGITSHYMINIYASSTRDFSGTFRWINQVEMTTDNWTGTTTVISNAVAVPGFTVANEYLFFQIWCHETLGFATPFSETIWQEGSDLADGSRTNFLTAAFTPYSVRTPLSVEAIIAIHQAGTGLGSMRVALDDNGTLGNIYSAEGVAGVTSLAYKRAHFATAPTGGAWNLNGAGAASLPNLKLRFGSPLAFDVNPDQYLDCVMLEVAMPEPSAPLLPSMPGNVQQLLRMGY